MNRFALITLSSVATLAVAPSARAITGPSLSNGGFETNSGAGQLKGGTYGIGSVTATGWTIGNSVAGTQYPQDYIGTVTADSPGVAKFTGDMLQLWGPGIGSSNGFGMATGGGTYFLAADAHFGGSVSQSVTGLTSGSRYTLSFDYALDGTTDGDSFTASGAWQSTFGSSTVTTPSLEVDYMAFSGWKHFTQTITASGTSATFSVVATQGLDNTYNNQVMLLDNVQVVAAAVPEPTSAAIVTAIAGVGATRRRRRR